MFKHQPNILKILQFMNSLSIKIFMLKFPNHKKLHKRNFKIIYLTLSQNKKRQKNKNHKLIIKMKSQNMKN